MQRKENVHRIAYGLCFVKVQVPGTKTRGFVPEQKGGTSPRTSRLTDRRARPPARMDERKTGRLQITDLGLDCI